MAESARERRKHLHEMLSEFPGLAPKGVMEVGYLLHDLLMGSVADEGTNVDTGAGTGAFDLWVKSGGHEYLVTVKHSGQCRNSEHLLGQISQ